MEKSNLVDCVVMDDEDTEESISLNDLRLMFAKLQEIHAKDSLRESELRTKLSEVRSASIERKVSRLRDEIKEIKDRIGSIKDENQILSKFNLDGFLENQKKVTDQLESSAELMIKDLIRLIERTSAIDEFVHKSKVTTPSQTELTFPPSFSSLNVFTVSPSSPSSSSCSSSLGKDKQFNAQDAFIEIQLDRKRQLEDQLKQLKKQMWFEGPEVMLVKLDAYEKLINKSSVRRRKKVQRTQSQFDCYLEISDHLEKRPCLETSRPPSPTSTNNGNGSTSQIDEVVQLIFTAPPKQTNGRGSHT